LRRFVTKNNNHFLGINRILIFSFLGEHPAAMQHGEHGAGSKLAAWSWTLTMAAFAFSYR